MIDAIEVYFDGSCEPVNPGGNMTWAFIVTADGLPPLTGSGFIEAAPENTNNVAEWLSLFYAISTIAESRLLSRARLVIRGDSKLVINQLTGDWRCNAPRLAKARDQVLALLRCRQWSAEWVPREQNERADALGREAYFRATGQVMPERTKWKKSA